MAIYRRFKVQQKYVNGQPTEEYRLGVEVDSTDYNSIEECNRGSDCTQLEYRWVDMESADDYICDGTNKYKKQMKQQKCVTEEAWTNVYPYEYQKGELIEHDSVDCGYSPTGEYHIYGATDGHGRINISPSFEYYSSTDVVKITALPSTDYIFSCYNYGRNLNYGSVTYSSVLSLTMMHDWYVSAVFRSIQYRVYNLTTFGGSLTISPSKEYYNKGDVVTINALPSTDYMFSNYSYGSTSEYGQNTTNSNLTLTMSNNWYVRGNFVYNATSGGNLYYSYSDGTESWYNWSESSLSKGDNSGMDASIIIDYGGVIKAIQSSAFKEHFYLTSISLPNCSEINFSGFYSCKKLINVNLPNCKKVWSRAFEGCYSLVSINLPLCTSVWGAAFADCYRLPSIDLPNCSYIDAAAFYGCEALTYINSPLCTLVSVNAFYHCYKLPSIDLPNCSLVYGHAFEECSALSTISLPNCIRVEGWAFRNCKALQSIDLPKCKIISSWVFDSCSSLTSVNLPLCTHINEGAFHECKVLKYVNLPLCVSIGLRAFNNCNSLVSIDLPNCSYVSNYAFSGCSNLRIVHLPKVNYFGYDVFDYTVIETLYMDQITSVPSGNDPLIGTIGYLKSIVIPCSLFDDFTSHSIWGKYSSYYVCDGEIKEIFTATDGGGTITLNPDGGKYYSGTTVNIGCETNPGYVFNYFQYGSTPAYGSTVLNESFSLVMSQNWYVSATFNMNTPSGTLYYSYSDGTESWYDWSMSTLSKSDNNGRMAEIIIDYGGVVQTIQNSAFLRCSELVSISLPNCSYVGVYGFYSCSWLGKINLPKCITVDNFAFEKTRIKYLDLPLCETVNRAAFYSCLSLKSINLPKCTIVSDNAFSNCINLLSISLPNCSHIFDDAFASCITLMFVDLPNCTYVGDGTFYSCKNLINVNLPSCWSVNTEAFAYCSALNSISLPKCEIIYGSAFVSCTSLQSINLPNCITVGIFAFTYCSRLVSISLPNCSNLSRYAFASCYSLTSIYLPNCTFVDSYTFFRCSKLSLVKLPKVTEFRSEVFQYAPVETLYMDQITSVPSGGDPNIESSYIKSIFIPCSLLNDFISHSIWSKYRSYFVCV